MADRAEERAECLCAEIDPSDCSCLVCEAYAYLEDTAKEEKAAALALANAALAETEGSDG